MKALPTAFRFLTILPIPGGADPSPETLGRSTGWFPVVGAVLGAAVGAVLMLPIPPIAAAALATAAMVILTRGLHLDGLGDTLDGFGGGRRDPAEILMIMKDPRAGNFAVAGIAVVLILKTAALTVLAEHRAWAAPAAAAIAARWAMAAGICLLRYARPHGGLGSPFFAHAGPGRLALATVSAAALLFVALPAGWGAVGAAGGAAALIGVAIIAYHKIGGVTGDVLGAMGEIAETVVLLTGAITAAQGMPLSAVWIGGRLLGPG